MGPDALKLVDLMFNENEYLCVSDSKYAYTSIEIKIGKSNKVPLISKKECVPIREVDGSKLILMAINPMKPNSNREDCNVSSFRSFLIEMDTGDINTQLKTIEHYGIPFSGQVYSGGKSVHTIVTLSEDIYDPKIYRTVANWILNIITYADKNCANASRSIRIPNSIRPETGVEQKLLSLRGRVSHKELFDWLNQYEHLRPRAREKRPVYGNGDYDRLSIWAKIMLRDGIVFNKGRNQTWYGLAYDFALAGFTEDQTIEELSKRFTEEHDFKEKEWLTCINSAFKHVAAKRD